jgi:septum formation inhibitor-activating ATPase MinD
MPISKNRKGHAKKAALRKTHIKERQNRAERMYQEMLEQLKTKNVSMVDMLNKEDANSLLSQTTITTNANEYTVVEAPEFVEPVILNTSRVL